MKKIFLSQPMSGLTNQQIIADRSKARADLMKHFKDEEIEIIDNTQMGEEDANKRSIDYIATDIQLMTEADMCYFIGDWQKHRGCIVEHMIATQYGIECLYETDIIPEGKIKVITEISYINSFIIDSVLESSIEKIIKNSDGTNPDVSKIEYMLEYSDGECTGWTTIK